MTIQYWERCVRALQTDGNRRPGNICISLACFAMSGFVLRPAGNGSGEIECLPFFPCCSNLVPLWCGAIQRWETMIIIGGKLEGFNLCEGKTAQAFSLFDFVLWVKDT